jgi:hypothetical protein
MMDRWLDSKLFFLRTTAFPSTAMDMPQKEAYEKRNLWMPDGNDAYHFCSRE